MSARGGEFLRFLGVGALATAIQYATFAALTVWSQLDVPLASGLGYLLGAAVSYTANHGFTFASTQAHRNAIVRFAAMAVAAWFLTVGLMTLMVNWLGWNKWVGQFATTAVCLLFNYLVARSWVFRSRVA